MLLSKMSWPSRRMSPSCRIPGIRSFRRLIERRKVDFPHPEGPISAVTERGGTARLIRLSACFFPYQKEKSPASIGPNCRVTSGAEEGACDVTDVIRTDQ